MQREGKAVSITAEVSEGNNCVCDMCFACDRVVKVRIPKTQYHDGKNVTTKYTAWWMCEACRDKLVQAISIPFRAGDGNGHE